MSRCRVLFMVLICKLELRNFIPASRADPSFLQPSNTIEPLLLIGHFSTLYRSTFISMQPSVDTIIHVGPQSQQDMTRDMVCRMRDRPRSPEMIIKDHCLELKTVAYHHIIFIT